MENELRDEVYSYFDPDGDMLLSEPATLLISYLFEKEPKAVETVMSNYRELFRDYEYKGQYSLVGIALVLVRLGKTRKKIFDKALDILQEDLENQCKESIFTLKQAKELHEMISHPKKYSYNYKIPNPVWPEVNHKNFPYVKGDTFVLYTDHPDELCKSFYGKYIAFTVVNIAYDRGILYPAVVVYNWYSDVPVDNLDTTGLELLEFCNKGCYLISISFSDRYDLFDNKKCIYIGNKNISKKTEKIVADEYIKGGNIPFIRLTHGASLRGMIAYPILVAKRNNKRTFTNGKVVEK